ncbi:exodeoxyribonuclease V gamma chain [Vibrio ponticus]|nr:exodeoxyribonuclease V gamma chain [Vibrio ponticus]
MSQWLKMALAKEFGVAANIEFPLPATFIWNMFTEVLPDVPKRSAFNKESMSWKLMHILPTMLDLPEFAPLQRYLLDDQDSSKLYQLAEKIADIFDGYLVYRPEWIASWESGQVVAEIGDELHGSRFYGKRFTIILWRWSSHLITVPIFMSISSIA